MMPVFEPSIFTKIIAGDIPSYKVYEDEDTFAFMDIHPIQPGHVLVVTKRQVENFYELTDDEYNALMATVKKIATKLHAVFPYKKRIAVIVEGLDVPHVHVKVFPIDSGQELRDIPDMGLDPDNTTLLELADKIRL